jgi:hypothetical protein
MLVNSIVRRTLKQSLAFMKGVVCSLFLMLIISAIMARV